MTYTTALGWSPVFEIYQNHSNISGRFQDRILSIQVSSYEGGGMADTIDIELDDRDWSLFEPSIGEGAGTLKVLMGYTQNALYEMGTFQIDELTHSGPDKKMSLHGNSAGANTNLKAPIITSFDGMTVGDIIGQIAGSAGVTPSVDPSLSDFKIPYLNHHGTPGRLLIELERRFDATYKFQDGKLSFTKRGTGLTVSGADLGTVTLYPEDLASWSIKANNFYAFSKVRASYLDRTKNQLVWIESSVKGSPNSTIPYMLDQPFGSQAEAQAAADAQMARLNRSTKQGTITLSKGCPEIKGASKVILSGFRTGIDDTYIVKSAIHTLSKDVGIGTRLTLYTDEGAGTTDSSSSTSEAPTTAPSLSEMAPEASTAPVDGATGRLRHE